MADGVADGTRDAHRNDESKHDTDHDCSDKPANHDHRRHVQSAGRLVGDAQRVVHARLRGVLRARQHVVGDFGSLRVQRLRRRPFSQQVLHCRGVVVRGRLGIVDALQVFLQPGDLSKLIKLLRHDLEIRLRVLDKLRVPLRLGTPRREAGGIAHIDDVVHNRDLLMTLGHVSRQLRLLVRKKLRAVLHKSARIVVHGLALLRQHLFTRRRALLEFCEKGLHRPRIALGGRLGLVNARNVFLVASDFAQFPGLLMHLTEFLDGLLEQRGVPGGLRLEVGHAHGSAHIANLADKRDLLLPFREVLLECFVLAVQEVHAILHVIAGGRVEGAAHAVHPGKRGHRVVHQGAVLGHVRLDCRNLAAELLEVNRGLGQLLRILNGRLHGLEFALPRFQVGFFLGQAITPHRIHGQQ